MLLLGIDTSTRRVGVVVANEHGMLARVELGGTDQREQPRHAENLAPAIAWCCEQCNVKVSQLSAVATRETTSYAPGSVHTTATALSPDCRTHAPTAGSPQCSPRAPTRRS